MPLPFLPPDCPAPRTSGSLSAAGALGILCFMWYRKCLLTQYFAAVVFSEAPTRTPKSARFTHDFMSLFAAVPTLVSTTSGCTSRSNSAFGI